MNTDLDDFAGRLATELRESLDAIPLDDVPWAQARTGGRARTSARRWRVLAPLTAAVTALLVAAIVIVVTLPGGRTGHDQFVAHPGWRVVATAHLNSRTTPAEITTGNGFVFAATWADGLLVRLDPVTLEQNGQLQVGSHRNGPISIAFGGGAVWVLNFADGRLWRIDPATMQPTMKVPLGGEPSRVGYGDGSVWVTVCCESTSSATRQRLLRIDPASGAITGSVDIPGEGETVTLAVGSRVLVASQNGPVLVVDPTSLAVLHRLHVACDGCVSVPGLAVADNGLYVAGPDSVWRFDATTGQRTATSPDLIAADTTTSLVVEPDGLGLWLAVDRSLLGLDPVSLEVDGRVRLSGATQIAAAGSWLYASRPGEVVRLSRSRVPDASVARSMCVQRLGGGVASAGLTTVGRIRTINIGGPAPGVVPGRHAFPGHDAGETAGWCWVPSAASPGTTGKTWNWYAVVAGAPAFHLFSEGGFEQAPTGPPQIP